MPIDNTLSEREKRYGSFKGHSMISQGLQHKMRTTLGWANLTPLQREALQMIQHKVARILNGDPDYADNWHDIQGYAKLAEDACGTTDSSD